MPEFTLMSAPVLAPGRCLGCGGHSGPVVDLMIRPDDPAFSMYLCERCVLEAAWLVGCASPDEVAELVEETQRLAGELEGLREQLEWERANKVVAVSDITQLIDRVRGAQVPTSYPDAQSGRSALASLEADAAGRWLADNQDSLDAGKGVGEFASGVCSETRVDGSPCTAVALPGRDVCLAHSKRKAAV